MVLNSTEKDNLYRFKCFAGKASCRKLEIIVYSFEQLGK